MRFRLDVTFQSYLQTLTIEKDNMIDRIASRTFASQFMENNKSQQFSLFDRLVLAVKNNRCDLIWSAAKKPQDFNMKDDAGKNLLFYAVYSKCEVALLYLLRVGTPYLQIDNEHKNLYHFITYSGSVQCLRTLTFYIKLTKLQRINQSLLKILENYGFKRTDMKDGKLKFSVSPKRESQFESLQEQASKLFTNYLNQYCKQIFDCLQKVDEVFQRNPIHLGCLNKYQKCLATLELLLDELHNPNINITSKVMMDINTTNQYLQQKIDPRLYEDTLKNLSQIPNADFVRESWKKYEREVKSKIKHLLEMKDKDNQSALYIASKNGSTAMINLLQKYSIDPETEYKQLIMKAADNNLARSHIIDLCDASKLSDVKPLNFLISCGEEVNGKKTIFGTFALIQSLKSYQQKNSLEPLIALIKSGADINIQDTNGWTVLHHASSLGLKQVIELLIKTANDTKIDINKVTNKRYHALHLAGMNEHPEVIQLLISNQKTKVNIDVADWDGCTALIHAAKKGSIKVLKVLLQLKANIYAKDVRDMTALHHAAFSNHHQCIRQLLNHDADYDKLRQMRSTKGKLAKDLCTDSKCFENVFTAARTGNVNLIRKLTSQNASLKDGVTIEKQRTPLILAVIAKSLPSVKFLIDTGADTYSQDKNGKSAANYCDQMLEQAKKNKKADDVRVLQQIKKLLG